MTTGWVYPVTLEPDTNGTILATFQDVPGANTFGDDEADAIRHAKDALVTVIEAYIKDRRPIPRPSAAAPGTSLVALPLMTAAKVELYEGMREKGWRKADLAKQLKWHGPQVDRMLDVRYASKVPQIEEALEAVGRQIVLVGFAPVVSAARPRPGVMAKRADMKNIDMKGIDHPKVVAPKRRPPHRSAAKVAARKR